MKNIRFYTTIALFLLIGMFQKTYASDIKDYYVIKAKILSKETKKALIYATVKLENGSIGTISNSEGDFELKIPIKTPKVKILISHIGYKNIAKEFSIETQERVNIYMEEARIPLQQIDIHPYDANMIIRKMLSQVSSNYSNDPKLMRAFYREAIKKRRHYVSISEAITDLRKASYTKMQNDQVKIFKARKSQAVKKMDTLMVKLQGGPSTAILLDVMKNTNFIFDTQFFNIYNCKMKTITKIDDRLHYVISFNPKSDIDFPIPFGDLYIDTNNMALTYAKFSLNLENEDESSKIFISKKPNGLKFTPIQADYIVKYKQKAGKWHFNYVRGELAFKCKWKKKIFNSKYSVITEMAITDIKDSDALKFKNKERFKRTTVLSDNISKFQDDNFWGEYNTIEPDSSIQNAIKKLNKNSN
ncbi:MAG: carboxypeptidase-like regulatory domain-containing protein [Marinifilaceae bacterium]|jgi:hypothetical protein|nr:carboxypeptidase-like regulatory domain-containing protein [Marinifilaceae bacterium]